MANSALTEFTLSRILPSAPAKKDVEIGGLQLSVQLSLGPALLWNIIGLDWKYVCGLGGAGGGEDAFKL